MKLFVIILSFKVLSFEVKLNSVDYLPYTTFAISHLNQHKYRFDLLEKINKQLSSISTQERKAIIENSIKEKVLNNDIIPQKQMNITTAFIRQVESKLKKDRSIYSKFVLKIISDLVLDYKFYFKGAFLNRYQSYSRNNPEEVKMYRDLSSIIKISSNILHQFMKISAKNFNKKISKTIKQGLKLAAEKSQFFYFFTEADSSNESFLIITKKKTKKQDVKQNTLKDAVKDLDSNLMESASEEVDKLKI